MFEDTLGKKQKIFPVTHAIYLRSQLTWCLQIKTYGPLNYLNERNITEQNVSLEN